MELYESAVEQKQDEIKNNTPDDTYKIAKVTSLFENGCPKLTFVGEEQESNKKYSYLYSYIPKVGDTVILIKTNNTYVILGEVAYDITPDEEIVMWTYDEIVNIVIENTISDQELTTLIDTRADTRISAKRCVLLNSDGTISNSSSNYNTFNNLSTSTLRHTGSYVGFFGKSPSSKQTVDTIYVTTDMTSEVIRNKLNAIINALKAYGLA